MSSCVVVVLVVEIIASDVDVRFLMSSLCLVAVRMFPVMMACSRLRVIDVIHHRCSQSPGGACGGEKDVKHDLMLMMMLFIIAFVWLV